MTRKVRIVKDNFAGYEVQLWRWWWPFWVQARSVTGRPVNTHSSMEEAQLHAESVLQHGNGQSVLWEKAA